jgi:hypothetical protein
VPPGNPHHGESLLAVNGCQLFDVRQNSRVRPQSQDFDATETPQQAALRAFAQILGKLYFVQLRENLRRILLDYGQKRRHPANAAFNAAC